MGGLDAAVAGTPERPVSAASLAWEFLRRSPAYRADYATHVERQEVLGVAAPSWGDGDDWGLVFPG